MNIVIEKRDYGHYWPVDESMNTAFLHFSGGFIGIIKERIQELTDIAALHGCTVTIKGA